jgi:hypothetical protein
MTPTQLLYRHQLLRQQLGVAARSSSGLAAINRHHAIAAAQNAILRSVASNGPFLSTHFDLLKGSSRSADLPPNALHSGMLKQRQLVEHAHLRGLLPPSSTQKRLSSAKPRKEEGGRDENAPIMLTENDVLCGRGGITNSHSGNMVFRSLVRARKLSYINAPKRCDKPRIAREIVAEILQRGGRFLERSDSGSWRQVDAERAAKKVSQALREGAPDMRRIPSEDECDSIKKPRKRARKESALKPPSVKEDATSDGESCQSDTASRECNPASGLDLLQAAALLKFKEETVE